DHQMIDDAEALAKLTARHPRGESSVMAQRRLAHSVLNARGEHEAATRLAVSMHEEDPELAVINTELDSALRAREGVALALLAKKRLDYVLRGAALEWGDGTRERALIAASASWQGDRMAFEELVAHRGRNPALLEVTREVLAKAEA